MKDKQIICKCNDKECGQCSFEEQLKRKEQECEELKEKLKEMNEVIRTETTRCSLVYFLQTDLDQLQAENKHLNDLLNQALKELEKTRETLTEIKEISNRSCCTQPTTTCEEYENCNECGRISDADAVQQILQKISECEE